MTATAEESDGGTRSPGRAGGANLSAMSVLDALAAPVRDFGSDNRAAMSPDAFAALAAANPLLADVRVLRDIDGLPRVVVGRRA